ncbi:hypothetical protein PY365_04540 [Roseiarcaceae bacterium H3SJ34-1]|uniref:hypothetical protein n=1 Tax=Terripilifer ovatus TaxID=3032367 RepID=UPI003AB95035|nr:hypothetical protein [Roseiarcaceae bacterium H3SJ34-1]
MRKATTDTRHAGLHLSGAIDCERLVYEPEDEHHGLLSAFVWRARGFAGRGEAWFVIEELREFCARLGACPIPDDRKPMLAGGFWNKEVPGVLDQAHVSIEISAHGSRGLVCVASQVATKAYFPATNDLQQRLTAVFIVNYCGLARFSRSWWRCSGATRKKRGLRQ